MVPSLIQNFVLCSYQGLGHRLFSFFLARHSESYILDLDLHSSKLVFTRGTRHDCIFWTEQITTDIFAAKTCFLHDKNNEHLGFPVVQWLRTCLPMQRTWVGSLVQEDLTCLGAIKPVNRNCWACTLEPMSLNHWSLHHRACAVQKEPLEGEAGTSQLENSPSSLQK